MSLKSKLQKTYLIIRKFVNPYFKRNNIIYRINNPFDFVERALFFNFEHDNRNYLLNKIKIGMTVLDIGSNIGDTFLKVAKKIGKRGFVYGFEPCKKTFDFAQKNIKLNKISNGRIYNFGFSDQNEIQKLFNNFFNRGSNHVSPIGKELISLKTLDEWIRDQQLIKIDVIKIDAEGYEYKILKGAQNTLEKFGPALFFEIDINFLERNGSSWKEISNFLTKAGYICLNTETGKIIGEEWKYNKKHIDIFAFKE